MVHAVVQTSLSTVQHTSTTKKRVHGASSKRKRLEDNDDYADNGSDRESKEELESNEQHEEQEAEPDPPTIEFDSWCASMKHLTENCKPTMTRGDRDQLKHLAINMRKAMHALAKVSM